MNPIHKQAAKAREIPTESKEGATYRHLSHTRPEAAFCSELKSYLDSFASQLNSEELNSEDPEDSTRLRRGLSKAGEPGEKRSGSIQRSMFISSAYVGLPYQESYHGFGHRCLLYGKLHP